jgi:SAM-dependent methyltransferase
VANRLIDQGFGYTGLDISPIAIDEARSTCPRGEFFVGDIISFSPERRYDLVLALHVFVHLVEDADWEKALDVVASSLKPDGLFLLRDPLPAERERVNVHVLTRSRAEYESALSARGLQFTDEASHEQLSHAHTVRWKSFGEEAAAP